MSQLNQPNPNYQPKEEVDIIDVIRYCYNGVKSLVVWLWSIFLTCVIYLIRKSLWLAIFVVIGIGAAACLYSVSPKFYSSSAIVSSNNLESSIVIGQLENLNYLFIKKNYAEVASILGISEADAAKIKSLTGYYGLLIGNGMGTNKLPAYYAKEYDWQDTTIKVSPNYFKILSQVYDENVYPVLSECLLRYMSSSSFGKQANTLREEQIKVQIANADRDITAIQQAIASYNESNSKSLIPIIAGEKQKSELTQMQEALTKLYTRKSELERQNTLFSTPATIIADFSKTYRPANRMIRNYLAPGAGVGLVLGLIGLLIWDNRKRIAAAVCEKK